MTSPQQALAQRIRELRRRHFGARGKAAFAQKLKVPLTDYDRYERGKVPPGEIMVRMCEVTGEDLQWLLTGSGSRGTVVISGARTRHQDLLARMAQMLDERPELAAPVEAFVDLLVRGRSGQSSATALPTPPTDHLIPVYDAREAPQALPRPDDTSGRHSLVKGIDVRSQSSTAQRCVISEPSVEPRTQEPRRTDLLVVETEAAVPRRFLHSAAIAGCFPNAFGVILAGDEMHPMFNAGDAAIVASGVSPKVGRPALCLVTGEESVRCRIWLGSDAGRVHLGRLADGGEEEVDADALHWSLEVLFRLAPAA